MTSADFIDVFWPLIAAEVFGIVILPLAIVLALSRFDRRLAVKRMHRMRREPAHFELGSVSPAIASLS